MATHPLLKFSNILPEAGNENVFSITNSETSTFLQITEAGKIPPTTHVLQLSKEDFTELFFSEQLRLPNARY